MSGDDTALEISSRVSIPLGEIEMDAVRAQGAGGQNVNKVASAIHLRFDIRASSLPDFYKERLLALKDRRISSDAVIVIKSQEHRSQEKNRNAALERLRELIRSVAATQRKRIPTKPTKASRQRRMDEKTQRGRQKDMRRKVTDY